VLWLTLKLPLPPLHMLRLARANLRRRKTQSSLAVLALFAGAFSVTFAALVIYNAQSTVMSVRPSDEGYNLLVFTTVEGESDASAQMVLQGAMETFTIDLINGSLNGEPITIEGRAESALNTDISFSGEWREDEAIALLPQAFDEAYDEGDNLTLQVNGQEQGVTLVGFYTPNREISITGGASGVIVPRQIAQRLGGEQTQVRVYGSFPVESLDAATTEIGAALPNALVFSRADVNDRLASTYRSLFIFAASVAGLAFVAGAVLIANAAGLTVVERRREIGVFKAVGYTSSHVLRLLLSEYGFLGVLAGVFGIIGSIVAIALINASVADAAMVVEPMIAAGMLLLSVSIAVISAAVVAWQPSRVRPLDVLRYE
jgi:putative ABC transport system permease protein